MQSGRTSYDKQQAARSLALVESQKHREMVTPECRTKSTVLKALFWSIQQLWNILFAVQGVRKALVDGAAGCALIRSLQQLSWLERWQVPINKPAGYRNGLGGRSSVTSPRIIQGSGRRKVRKARLTLWG